MPILFGAVLFGATARTAPAYITTPVPTLGVLAESTYITVVRVEKVNREKGIVVYSKVRDLKGKYPTDKIRHVFDLKNTPRHMGAGDVPVKPDEKDWAHAVKWAEVGKTAVMFTRKYDPFGDFGHTYIDGCWYATMCPARDWDLWYAIYADPTLLGRWHCGTPDQLIPAVEAILAGAEAVVPVLCEGSRDDLRQGKAKIKGMKVGTKIADHVPERDLVTRLLDKSMVPAIVAALPAGKEADRAAAARELGLLGPDAKAAVAPLADIIRKDPSGAMRMAAADALLRIGPEARAALPALKEALGDPGLVARKDVLTKLTEVYDRLK